MTVPEIKLPDRLPPTNLRKAWNDDDDLFVCDVADAAIKELMPTLEHPFYSLSKKPVTTIREYRRGDNWMRIVPSVAGMATIYDQDVLIYAVSQVIAAMKEGKDPQQRVRINAHDFLLFTKRNTGGKDYKAICNSITRLNGTMIETNIRTGGEEQFDSFGLIESGTVRREYGLSGRLLWVEIKLSDWVFNAIKSKEVLTMHRGYFLISKPLARRIYQLGRKHCGQQAGWAVSLKVLHEKSGSTGSLKLFRGYVKGIAEAGDLPDYDLIFDEDSDKLIFTNRNTMPLDRLKAVEASKSIIGRLSDDIYDRARAIADGWDIYHVAQCFGAWWVKIGKPEIKSADALFLKFCKTWQEKNGRPS
jgi:plasmid replication initiation protein